MDVSASCVVAAARGRPVLPAPWIDPRELAVQRPAGGEAVEATLDEGGEGGLLGASGGEGHGLAEPPEHDDASVVEDGYGGGVDVAGAEDGLGPGESAVGVPAGEVEVVHQAARDLVAADERDLVGSTGGEDDATAGVAPEGIDLAVGADGEIDDVVVVLAGDVGGPEEGAVGLVDGEAPSLPP